MSKSIKVKEVASEENFFLKSNDKIIDAAKMMKENNISSVIVISDEFYPIGLITERDIIQRIVAEEKDPSKEELKAHMSSPVLKIDPDAELVEAMKKMIDNKVKRLVLIKDNELEGMISYSDIIKVSPDLLEIIYNKSKVEDIQEFESEEDEDEVDEDFDENISGICEICGEESDNLKENEEGLFVCEECLED
ncbi:MAG: CBS domain-containing protein [Candidatus Lokiarchaeota archaeon]|nr:CBS domain-containing protein [Candidatus Lokiarchaeota archaeon]